MTVETPVSIVLPTYNRAHTLPRAVESVLRQTHERFELIVVDDSSTDDTVAVLDQFQDKRLRRIHLPTNRGPGAARNAGIKEARYDLIAFQDSDDVWFDDKLALQVAALREGIGVVYHDIIRVQRDGTHVLKCTPDTIPLPIIERIDAAGELGIVWCLIRKKLIESVGGFDEYMGPDEDTDLLVKLRLIADFARIPLPLVYYFESPDGLTQNWKKLADSNRRFLRLHAKELAPYKSFVARALASIARLERKQKEQERLNENRNV